MLSEIATGTRGGKVVALVDVRRAYFYAPARRSILWQLCTETTSQSGGERSVVKFLIKMISRKYEIKKQVIGEDPQTLKRAEEY